MKNFSQIRTPNLEEAKYTNVHNKIKNIKNLSRKEAEFIANIDPAVMGQVVKVLMPMFEEVQYVSEEQAQQRFVFDTSMQMKKGEKLAKKFDLKSDTEKQMGMFFILISGDIKNITKWIKAMG